MFKWLKKISNKSNEIPYLILMEHSEPSIYKHLYGKACYVKKDWFDYCPSNFNTPDARLRHLQQSLNDRKQMRNKHYEYVKDLDKDIVFLEKACKITDHGNDKTCYPKTNLWKWITRCDNKSVIPKPYNEEDVIRLKNKIKRQ